MPNSSKPDKPAIPNSKPDYQAVLQALPTLSPRQLQAVLHRCKARLQLTPGLPSNTKTRAREETGERLILGVICTAMKEMGAEYTEPPVLRRMRAYPSFARKVPALLQFLQAAGIKHKNESRAVLRVGVMLLHRNFKHLMIPCDANMIMRHLHRIPACLECEFPGYAKAGLLGKIIR